MTFEVMSEIPNNVTGHSTHFQVGGDNPKVEGCTFF